MATTLGGAASQSPVEPLLRTLAEVDALTTWRGEHSPASTNCRVDEATITLLPATVFRIQTVISCTLEVLRDALRDEAVLRACDPTLDKLVLLDDSPQTQTTTIYTSYKQPAMFVSARDFVVQSTQQMLSVSEWCAYGGAVQSVTGAVIFVQSSTSTTHPSAPRAGSGTAFVRGSVHLFGYVATECVLLTAGRGVEILVKKYCCVDPNGFVPQWLVKTAIGQQAESLAKLRALCQDRQLTVGTVPRLAEPPSLNRSPTTTRLSAGAGEAGQTTLTSEVSDNDDDALSDDSFQSARSMRSSQSILTFEDASPDDGAASLPQQWDRDGSLSPLDAQRVLTFASVSASPAISDSQCATVTHAHRNTREEREGRTSPRQGEAVPRTSPPSAAHEKETVLRLAALARAKGWSVYEEGDDGIIVDHLCRLPFLFASMIRNRQLPVAVRVSRLLACSLADVATVLDDVDATALWDPGCASHLFVSRTPGRAHASPSARVPDALHARQYRFARFRAGEPWSATWTYTPCCLHGDSEVGAQLGFFTPGMRGACRVWGGFQTGREDCPSDPHRVHRDVTTLSVGLVAVAIPADAKLVRVSHYALMDFSGASEQEVSSRAHKSMLQQLTRNMKARIAMLTTKCLERERMPNALDAARPSPVTAIAARPALWELVESIRSVAQAPVVQESYEHAGGRRVQVRSVPALSAGTAGRVYVFTVTVRCSLSAVQTFLGVTGGEAPLLPPLESFASHVAALRQLPSPPGAGIFEVTYGTDCACYQNLAFCFMEVSGMLADNDYRAFALSRVNCSTPGREVATLNCDGYVAEPLDLAAGGTGIHSVCLRHIIATDVSPTCREAIMCTPSTNLFVTAHATQLVHLAKSLESLPIR